MYRKGKNGAALTLCLFAASALIAPAAIADTVKFTPFGMVVEKCGIMPTSTMDHTVVLGTATKVDFKVDCNVPVKVQLVAENGTLLLDETVSHVSGDYTDLVKYVAGFTLPLAGGNWTVEGQSGEDLKNGKTFTPPEQLKDSPPFDETLALILDWQTPAAALLAGTYSETITITVTGQDMPNGGTS